MISDYRSMKQRYGVDRMLQKVQQELDTNVPVLEGTDVEAWKLRRLSSGTIPYFWSPFTCLNHVEKADREYKRENDV